MASVSDNNEQIERGIKMMEYQDQSLRARVFQRLREDMVNTKKMMSLGRFPSGMNWELAVHR